MSDRVKVGFYVNEWNYAGTARSHERIIQGLNPNIFKPYVLHWNEALTDTRLNVVGRLALDKGGEMIPYSRSTQRLGADKGYAPVSSDLFEKLKNLKLDVLHMGRGGYFEWPFTERLSTVQVETNIFGDVDTSPYLDVSLPISQWVKNRRGGTGDVIFNPIPEAELYGGNLRAAFRIPENALVAGRIGRPGNWAQYGVEGFNELVKHDPNARYIIIAPTPEDKQCYLGNPNVILLDETDDDSFIEEFFRTLDIFMHYRMDGETFGTAIVQAMSYGIPVVSHTSPIYGAQTEIIGDGGFVASSVEEYREYVAKLSNRRYREEIGLKARAMFLKNYNLDNVVRQYEIAYLNALRLKNAN